jgi:hypothetical protein
MLSFMRDNYIEIKEHFECENISDFVSLYRKSAMTTMYLLDIFSRY